MSNTLVRIKNNKHSGKIRKDIPVHERKILENILSSNNEPCDNRIQTEKVKYELKGKLEIIEILKDLNMISNESFINIKQESGKICKTDNEIFVHF